MIRVLHFVSTPSIGSGVMSVIMNYYRHMDRSKIQFDFLCFIPCEDSYEKEINELGGRVFFVPKPGSSLKSIKELWGFFKSHKGEYQWLHNHEVYLSFLLKPLANQFQIPKFIVHCHATQYSDRRMAAIRNRVLCFPIKHMKCQRVACSNAAGKFLYGKNSYTVLPNAVERSRFIYKEEIRKHYRDKYALNGFFVLGHIGRFTPQKNHKYLVELFESVHKEIPNTRLLLIGEGPLVESVQCQIEELGLSNAVLVMGRREDVPELLQAMDLFLLPSIFEGLPLVCMEAQAAGLPCLVSENITEEVIYSEKTMRIPLWNKSVWIDESKKTLQSQKCGLMEGVRTCPENLPDIILEAQKLLDFYKKGRGDI